MIINEVAEQRSAASTVNVRARPLRELDPSGDELIVRPGFTCQTPCVYGTAISPSSGDDAQYRAADAS